MKKGLTLMELIVVIIIVAVLAGVLIPLAAVTIRRAKIQRTEEKMDNLNDALLLYFEDYGTFPPDTDSDPDDLTVLEPNYIRESEYPDDYAFDAWRVPFKYTYDVGAVSATLRSFGPDRTEGTADDIFYIVLAKGIIKRWRMVTQDELQKITEAVQEYLRDGNELTASSTTEDLADYLPDESYIYDVWGNPYHWSTELGTFYSYGPDEAPGTEDDIYPRGYPTP